MADVLPSEYSEGDTSSLAIKYYAKEETELDYNQAHKNYNT